ncbi:MAG: nitrilase-related carbon-nitrogen hydrolase [Propionibacteriaceae bacterium]
MTIRCALAQIRSGADVTMNLVTITEASRRAAARGAQVVVFPEAAMSQQVSQLADIAEPLDGFFATAIRSLARELGVVLVVGFWERLDPGGVGTGPAIANTLIITDGSTVDTSYRKIHTYDAFGYRESDQICAGRELVTVDVCGGRLGFATCYDLRFPEQFQQLGRRGAELIVVPASWGAGPLKREQFQTLVRARALDGQCFLAACDQAWTEGTGAEPLGVGASALVSPFGEVLVEAGEEPELLIADCDLDVVARARAVLPLFGADNPGANPEDSLKVE